MAQKGVIDIHCHWFNIKFPIKELTVASWNMIRGNYPHRSTERKVETGLIYRKTGESAITRYAKWVASIAKTLVSSSDENYEKMNDAFRKSSLGHERTIKMVPLMMDLYYSLHNNDDEEIKDVPRGGTRSFQVEPFEIDGEHSQEFSDHVDQIRQTVLSAMAGGRKAMRGVRREVVQNQVSEVFEQVKDELLPVKSQVRRLRGQYQEIELSPGFIDQMHDLEEIRKKHPVQVFPFLAVDPRRLGILKLIQMKVNKKEGPFFGIKLYTPLGYLLTHPNLAPIFEYCEDEAIPITAHTSLGGVKNFCNKIYVSSEKPGYRKDFKKADKSEFFADPDNWIPVLENWKNLHLNLAHFGGGDRFTSPDHDWRKKITKLLKAPQYPNVFTDISYFTKESAAADVNDFLKKNPALKKRLLFGTDFVMIALDSELGGLSQYFSNFSGMTNEILYQNAIDFLASPAVTSAQK